MRRLTISLAFLVIAVLVTDVSAQKPQKDRGQGPAASEDGAAGPKGNRPGRPGFRGQGFGAQGGRPNRDPAQMVARMIKQFDKDGDEKLNSTELTAMFSMMQQRGGRGMGQGRPGQGRPGQGRPGQGRLGQGRPGQGTPGQGTPGQRRRRPGSDPPAAPGGDKPQRPPIEL